MISLLFIIAGFLTFVPFYIDFKSRSPFVLLWLLNFVFVFLPIFVNYVSNSNYSEKVIQESLLFYSACNLIYTLVVLFVFKGDKYLKIVDFPLGSYNHTIYLIYIAILVIIITFIASGVSFNRVINSTLEDKRELGGAQLVIIFFISFLSPYVIWLLKEKKYKTFLAIILIYLIILLYYRSRSILSFMLLPLAYYFFIWGRKGKIKLVVLGGLAYFISQIIKVIRYQGALTNGLSYDVIANNLPTIIKSNFEEGRGDLSIGTIYLNVVRDYSEGIVFGNFTIIEKFLSKFFPFINEPRTIEYLLWDFYYDFGNGGGSLHPTCYGVAYGDGAWYGIIYFIILAFLRSYIQIIIIMTKDLKMLGFTMYFILFFSRGSIYNGFIFMFIPLVIWSIILFHLQQKNSLNEKLY
jgi:hypothetical protein